MNNLFHWSIQDLYSVKNYKPKGSKVLLIRVLEPNYNTKNNSDLNYRDNYNSILELKFQDIREYPPKEYLNRFVLFDADMASFLIDFIKNNLDADEIVVHCSSGQSRSSALMIGISRLLNRQDIEEEINNNNYYNPNPLVLEQFMEALKKTHL